MGNIPWPLERGTRRRQSPVMDVPRTADVPRTDAEAKLTEEVGTMVKWAQSPDVPCSEPSLPKDSLLGKIINLLMFKPVKSKFSASCCQHI